MRRPGSATRPRATDDRELTRPVTTSSGSPRSPEFTAVDQGCVWTSTTHSSWTEVDASPVRDWCRTRPATHRFASTECGIPSTAANRRVRPRLPLTLHSVRHWAPGRRRATAPREETLAGLKIVSPVDLRPVPGSGHVMATGVGWPWAAPETRVAAGRSPTRRPVTRPASRTRRTTQIQITNNRPDGPRTYTIPGQIPQDARRVVFHDAEYDGQARRLQPHTLTWHWDNIQVHAAAATATPAPPRIDLMAPVSVPPQAGAVPRQVRTRFPGRSALQQPKSSPAVAPPSRPATSWALGSLSLPSHWRSSCGRPERVAEPNDRRTRLAPAVPSEERDRVGGKVVAELAAGC